MKIGNPQPVLRYEGLTQDENELIAEARACGYGSFYPCVPDAESQGRSTLKGAKNWLKTHHIPVSPDDPGDSYGKYGGV